MEIFDDCIALLIYIVLPILEKRGIKEDLRTFSLLEYLCDYRFYRSKYFDFANIMEPTGLMGNYYNSKNIDNSSSNNNSKNNNNSNNNSSTKEIDKDMEYEKELLLNESWYKSKQNVASKQIIDSPFDLINPSSVNINNTEYGLYGEPVYAILAHSQLAPFGWGDVIEHVRFRLELSLDEYEVGSVVSFYGSSALSVCDRNSKVNLMIKIPSLGEKTLKLMSEKNEIKQKIMNSIPTTLSSTMLINKSQYILSKISDCILLTRNTIIEHVNKQKKIIDTRSLSKLNADSELICKIGDRLIESSQKDIAIHKQENNDLKLTNNFLKKLRTSLVNIEKNILLDRENMLNMLGGLVPHIGYHVHQTEETYGKKNGIFFFFMISELYFFYLFFTLLFFLLSLSLYLYPFISLSLSLYLYPSISLSLSLYLSLAIPLSLSLYLSLSHYPFVSIPLSLSLSLSNFLCHSPLCFILYLCLSHNISLSLCPSLCLSLSFSLSVSLFLSLSLSFSVCPSLPLSFTLSLFHTLSLSLSHSLSVSLTFPSVSHSLYLSLFVRSKCTPLC